LAGGVVELDEVFGVDVTVPSASRNHDEAACVEWHALVAVVIEKFDGHGSCECEEQLVGVGVHLPGSGSLAVGPEDGELTTVERHEIVERQLLVGVGVSTGR
jgi:hypothetical protein